MATRPRNRRRSDPPGAGAAPRKRSADGGATPESMKGPTMSQRVQFENIEEMRRTAGIDDVELREAIRQLQVGDSVKLTLLIAGSFPGEPVIVRITSINGNQFRGKLASGRHVSRRAN